MRDTRYVVFMGSVMRLFDELKQKLILLATYR